MDLRRIPGPQGRPVGSGTQDVLHLDLHVELRQAVLPLQVTGNGVQLLTVLGRQLLEGFEPGPHRPTFHTGQGRLGAPAAGMARHHDVADCQVHDGELQDRLEVAIVQRSLIGDVPVDEELAGLGPQHAVDAHPGVGASDEEEGGFLPFRQLAEVVRIVP